MTQLVQARKGTITKEMKEVALSEGRAAEAIRGDVEEGVTVVIKNTRRKGTTALAVGRRLKTKVNANIGTSGDKADINEELAKLHAAVTAGADAVMDLSTGGDLVAIRRAILDESTVPIGTVPLYQAAVEGAAKGKSFIELEGEALFDVIEAQAEEGVDFMTVHSGVNLSALEKVAGEDRIMGIVSRGGALTAEWMRKNKKENPLFEDYDRLVKIAKKYDVILSLGDGLRPGCLHDATDRAQIEELITLGELCRRARAEGVQVMIEGPGHVPIDQIEANILLQKQLCDGAPFYVLGPLVTDIAPGYDHITSAIGGAIAAKAGADFLCYVTPTEHLSLPGVDDVREGVIASRIAAHAGDIAKDKKFMEEDNELSRARKALDWDTQIRLSINPDRAKRLRDSAPPEDGDVCSMCSNLCAIKVGEG
ncbi:MAG: phosphomethylpyrimidine synthase ThiC [Thermodesulfobacteriota bacterium]